MTSGSAPGHTVVNRNNSATYDLYKAGALLLGGNAQVSSAPPSARVIIGAQDNGGTAANFSSRVISAVHAGAALTAQNISDLYDALQVFLTSI